jgi:hypothetical protein
MMVDIADSIAQARDAFAEPVIWPDRTIANFAAWIIHNILRYTALMHRNAFLHLRPLKPIALAA